MNRSVIIALVAFDAASATTVLVINITENGKPALTEEQCAVREKFCGSDKELPPIEDGQEMRPR